MITEIAVERVIFRCPESHWRSEADYDVVLYTDAVGDTWEFFSLNGTPVPSPYDVDGAPFCPVCHRAVLGRPMARRFIPVPPGTRGWPRRPVQDTEEHRARQLDLPLLPGTATTPGQ